MTFLKVTTTQEHLKPAVLADAQTIGGGGTPIPTTGQLWPRGVR